MKRRVLAVLCVVALARPAAAQMPTDPCPAEASQARRGALQTPTVTIVAIELWRAAVRFDFDKESVPPGDAHPRGPARQTIWIFMKIGGAWYAFRVTEPRVLPAVAPAPVHLVSALEARQSLDARAGK